MSGIRYSKNLNAQERAELDAMHALLVQNELAYFRAAGRREAKDLHSGKPIDSIFSSVDDPYLQGWQASISALAHTFGETRHHYEVAAAKRAQEAQG